MSVKRRASVLAIAAAGILAVSACSSSSSSSPSASGGGASASTGGTIQIGVLADETGAVSAYGLPQLNGTRLAAAQINASGGINGKKIVLNVQDTTSSPTQAATLFRGMSGDAAVVLCGTSGELLSLAPLAESLKIPVIADSSFDKFAAGQLNDYTFHAASTETNGILALFQQLIKSHPFKRLALINDSSNAFPVAEATAIKSIASQVGFTVVAATTAATTATDLTTQIDQIKSSNPDMIWDGLIGANASAIMKDMRNVGVQAPFVGGQTIATPSIFQLAGTASTGSYTWTSYLPGTPRAAIDNFDTAYTTAYKTAPNEYSAFGYAGMQVVTQAIKNANSTESSKIRDALANLTVSTVAGQIEFQGGPYNVANNWILVQWDGSAFKAVS
jgi:branched-chain amino acid transport system substrate-binding protein